MSGISAKNTVQRQQYFPDLAIISRHENKYTEQLRQFFPDLEIKSLPITQFYNSQGYFLRQLTYSQRVSEEQVLSLKTQKDAPKYGLANNKGLENLFPHLLGEINITSNCYNGFYPISDKFFIRPTSEKCFVRVILHLKNRNRQKSGQFFKSYLLLNLSKSF